MSEPQGLAHFSGIISDQVYSPRFFSLYLDRFKGGRSLSYNLKRTYVRSRSVKNSLSA